MHVIKLTEVIQHGFPIAVDRNGLVLHQRHVLELIVGHQWQHIPEKCFERWRLLVEVDPVEPQRFLAAHLG